MGALQSSQHEQELQHKRRSSLEQPIILNVPVDPPKSDRAPPSISSGVSCMAVEQKQPRSVDISAVLQQVLEPVEEIDGTPKHTLEGISPSEKAGPCAAVRMPKPWPVEK